MVIEQQELIFNTPSTSERRSILSFGNHSRGEEIRISIMVTSLGRGDLKETAMLPGANKLLITPCTCSSCSNRLGSAGKSTPAIIGPSPTNNPRDPISLRFLVP